ncbi:alpha/beta hydrolase [Streptomyces sp. NEAU-W12]|uniref:alpha/beta hydrolase n=1 Tax=Streptomyces sp. NEAU-W12 TaxID=2994668 RepID=UPI00224AF7E2|nr:alpha/beta hydrolase-fold protein [Streptomyces sp. NEAU-W12]MCX2926301.1 alpha/beta hydrolase-fold protein [Streptomyces sp. NEAU-W12]
MTPLHKPHTRAALVTTVLMLMTGAAQDAAAPSEPDQHGSDADVVDERRVAPRIVDLTVDSPAMGGEAKVRLLTPDGWERGESGKKWPVLYLLAGGDGDYETWTEEESYAVQEVAELRDVLVVMPQMPMFGFYTDWHNGGENGPPAVESFHLKEVLPILERDYGAGSTRAAAGESQGGFGALSYAARNEWMFEAVASYSGYVHPLQHTHAIETAVDHLNKADLMDTDWKDIWGDPETNRENWKRHDPYYLADKLRSVPVYLSSGDGTAGVLDPPGFEDEYVPGLEDPDEPFAEDVVSPTETLMDRESKAVAQQLQRTGADVTTHFYKGTHSPQYWKREFQRSLPILLYALGTRPAGR